MTMGQTAIPEDLISKAEKFITLIEEHPSDPPVDAVVILGVPFDGGASPHIAVRTSFSCEDVEHRDQLISLLRVLLMELEAGTDYRVTPQA